METMVVGTRELRGRVNGLGQNGNGSKDLERVLTTSDFMKEPFTREEAIASYNWAILTQSVYMKSRFLGLLFKDLLKDPRVLGGVRDNPSYGGFIRGANEVSKLALRFKQAPNFIQTLGNMVGTLEVQVLQNKHRIAVMGHKALFRENLKTLDRVRFGMVAPEGYEQLDVGDLSKTTLLDDLIKLEILSRDLSGKNSASMGALLVTLAVIALLIILVAQFAVIPAIKAVTGDVKGVIGALEDSPNLQTLLKTLTPEALETYLNRLAGGRNLLEQAVSLVKWSLIGLGTLLVVGGGAYYYFGEG